MSHVESVTPAGPLVLAPGGSATIDVFVSGVPGDQSGTLRFTGSDGSVITVSTTVDFDSLVGILSGSPADNEVLGEAIGVPVTLSLVGGIPGGYRFLAVADAA